MKSFVVASFFSLAGPPAFAASDTSSPSNDASTPGRTQNRYAEAAPSGSSTYSPERNIRSGSGGNEAEGSPDRSARH